MADVALSGVRKQYGSGAAARVVVPRIDLEIAHGELLVMVGPSGCGKSTVLRMIAGLEELSAGELRIGGVRMNDVAPGERDIAMVFQNYALYPHMTIYDNLAFALRLRGVSGTELDTRVRAAATAMHIDGMLTRYPRQLSGGERQRVALGRALVRQPQVFLFDEPLSNLDARLRVEMRREIARLHRELATTMIYVTHDQVEAMTLGDRIVVLRDGSIEQVDTPSVLYETPRTEFVARFIGSPAMNLLRGAIHRIDGALRVTNAQGLDLAVPAVWQYALEPRSGQEIHVGVRPEHLHRTTSGPPNADAANISVRVDLVEQLGNDCIVHGELITTGSATTMRGASSTRTDAQDIALRCAPTDAPARGEIIALRMAREALHFFDPVTGQRIDS